MLRDRTKLEAWLGDEAQTTIFCIHVIITMVVTNPDFDELPVEGGLEKTEREHHMIDREEELLQF